MKHIKIFLLAALPLFIVVNLSARQNQQDPTGLTQEIDYYINNLGDADLEIRMKMNAMQWQAFKASPVASNPTIFKRDMERQMAAYIIEDLKTDLDENNRSSKTTLKARSIAQYKGNGKWEVKLDMKHPNVTKVSDNCYLLTGNLLSGGGLIQQLQKIFLPANASDIKQDTDTFGNAVITYNLDAEPSRMNFLAIGGIVMMMGGIALYFVMGRMA